MRGSAALAVCTALMLALVLAAPLTAGAGIVGHLVSDGASIDGARVPSGTALPADARLIAHDGPAVVHLNNRQVLHLAQGSQVRFSGSRPDEVDVDVDAGAVYVRSDDGEVVALTAGSAAAFFQDEPAIGQGQAVEEDEGEVAICHLKDPTPDRVQLCTVDDPEDRDCRWKRIEVDASELDAHFGHGDVYADKDRREEAGQREDIDCRKGFFLILPPPATAALAAGTVVILSEVTDDDPPASPVGPPN